MHVSTRFRLALLIYGMVNAVVFGIGVVLVLGVPSLSQWALQLMPVVVALSFILAAPIAWFLAPRLRLRFWRTQEARERREREDATLHHGHGVR
ncbi:hypothetical protein M2352_003033 [Azospirillum fermentarium]|uniref:hypothetical protein n=1 Tax=Azospirillum fermentarium TaxID=1233114 RepID=UPI002225DE90|nr:hypothetical protein [Azospirillum fermentarium]MCW2247399.1 hypothetical protein [Azospirillum fermentarium]